MRGGDFATTSVATQSKEKVEQNKHRRKRAEKRQERASILDMAEVENIDSMLYLFCIGFACWVKVSVNALCHLLIVKYNNDCHSITVAIC